MTMLAGSLGVGPGASYVATTVASAAVPEAPWVKLTAHFVRVMLRAGHTTSWMTGTWGPTGDERGRFFLYFTVNTEQAVRAEAVMRGADLLCNEVLDGPRTFR